MINLKGQNQTFEKYDCHSIYSIYQKNHDPPFKKGNLLVGHEESINQNTFRSCHIASVISINNHLQLALKIQNIAKSLQNQQKLTQHYIPLLQQKPAFEESYHFIKKQLQKSQGNVFMYSYGASRCTSMLVAFLMRQYQMKYKEGVQYIQKKSAHNFFILPKFEVQLIEYQNKIRQKKNQQDQNYYGGVQIIPNVDPPPLKQHVSHHTRNYKALMRNIYGQEQNQRQ